MTALGIRNNNPLNIRYSLRNKWVGQGEPVGGLCTYDTSVNGIRAGAMLIQAHYDRRGAATIRDLIEIWAPASENNTEAYIRNVEKLSGFRADEVLDFHAHEHIKPVLIGMIRVECGQQPYSDAVIDQGLARAGIVPDTKPLTKSRTITGAKVAGASTVAGLGIETARQVADYASDFAPIISMLLRFGPWVIGGIVLASIGYVVYARWDDRRRGLR